MKNRICLLSLITLLLSISCKKQVAENVSYIEWSEIYGGSGLEVGYGAAPGMNTGYIVVGYTNSNDGDVIGQNHCTTFTDVNGKNQQYCGHDDGWILRISEDGGIIRTSGRAVYGGADLLPAYNFISSEQIKPEPNSDRLTCIDVDSTGLLLIAGQSNSWTNDWFKTIFSRNNKPWNEGTPYNPTRPWMGQMDKAADSIKLDSTNKISAKDFGWHDSVTCVKALASKGYAIAGFRDSSINNVDGNAGEAFIITKATTRPVFFGGNLIDKLRGVTQIMDVSRSLIAVGQTNSTDLPGNPNRGGYDLWVAKRNANGTGTITAATSKTFGGEGNDIANTVINTSDGGFIVAGQTNSNDGDVSGNHSSRYDAWVIRFDPGMNVMWKKTYGGAFGDENAKSIVQTADHGFVFVGQTSSNDGDVKGNHGYGDAWVVKIDKDGNLQWQQTLGGSSEDCANNVIVTSDGGLLVTGYSFSNDGDISRFLGGGNLWVVKLRRQ